MFNEEPDGEGDVRCCQRHPWVVTHSQDGLHGGECGACEYETETGECVTTPGPKTAPTPRVFVRTIPEDEIPF